MALASPAAKVGTVAAQVVSAIASVELPMGQWMDVVGILLGFVSDQSNGNLRIATLQAIGFICESIQSVRTMPDISKGQPSYTAAETGNSINAFKRDFDLCNSRCV